MSQPEKSAPMTSHARQAEPAQSGVHRARRRPQTEEDWREILAPEGEELAGEVEALLSAYERLRRRQAEVAMNAEALAKTLDHLPIGVIMLEDDRVVVSNQAADKLLNGTVFRRGIDDRLSSSEPEVQEQLKGIIEYVASGMSDREAVALEANGQRLHIVVTLVGERDSGGPNLLMAISDPSSVPNADADAYRALYGLTRTEAEVARQMVLGKTPREIAETLEVGVETTRTHVKHILQKTGCHRQVDAVRLFVTGPAALK